MQRWSSPFFFLMKRIEAAAKAIYTVQIADKEVQNEEDPPPLYTPDTAKTLLVDQLEGVPGLVEEEFWEEYLPHLPGLIGQP